MRVPWEETGHTVTSREEDIARVDMARRVVIGGEPDDETSLLIKDGEGNIVKGVPIRYGEIVCQKININIFKGRKQNEQYELC